MRRDRRDDNKRDGGRESSVHIDGEGGEGRRARWRRHPGPAKSRLIYRVSCDTGISRGVLRALFSNREPKFRGHLKEEAVVPVTRISYQTNDFVLGWRPFKYYSILFLLALTKIFLNLWGFTR